MIVFPKKKEANAANHKSMLLSKMKATMLHGTTDSPKKLYKSWKRSKIFFFGIRD